MIFVFVIGFPAFVFSALSFAFRDYAHQTAAQARVRLDRFGFIYRLLKPESARSIAAACLRVPSSDFTTCASLCS